MYTTMSPLNISNWARFASLRATSSRLCYIASETDDSFRIARDDIVRLTTKLEETCSITNSSFLLSNKRNVRDALRKKGKRKESKDKDLHSSRPHKCSLCNTNGHSKNTCPRLKLQLKTPAVPTFFDEDFTFSRSHGPQ
ncbi:hypothetical protein V6N11_002253 [Hibiscus sabdariffa]|uniref:Uncharacterized protein n=1 Tax=Hibiscus sabdariffa TaxID=183260 RepID=A0ABR2QUP6_9ROSI